jgi:WD40 repeat protein
VWDAKTGEEIARMAHETELEAVVFSPDGQWVASGGSSTVQVWKAETDVEITQTANMGAVRSMAFSPDGKRIASGGRLGTVRMWKAETGVDIAQMVHMDGTTVNAVALSPDGRWVASKIIVLETVRVWEVETSTEIAWLADEALADAVAFSPDGQSIASVTEDSSIGSREVRVWDLATGAEIARLAHEAEVGALAFSPDGQLIASGSRDGMVRVWEVETGTEIFRLTHGGWVETVVFSPDGRWIASVAWQEDTVRVWDVETGVQIAWLVHDRTVNAVALSPDGRWLASASGNWPSEVWVWDVETGAQIARLTYDRVVAVAFNPDGQRLSLGSGDGTVQVWLWRPEVLVAEACAHLARNLKWEEWHRYLGDEQPYRKTCDDLPVHTSAILGIIDQAEAFARHGDSQAASSAYEQAIQWASETDSAYLSNDICGAGSLYGFAELVLLTCERAVELEPDNAEYHDRRGLARALTGGYAGAVEDFEFTVERWKERLEEIEGAYMPAESKQDILEDVQKREAWISKLEMGRNPFDAETLEALRDE